MSPTLLSRILRRLRRRAGTDEVSTAYRPLDLSERLDGWLATEVAARQHLAFAPLVRQAFDGQPREDFQAAAWAVGSARAAFPFVVEVGCGSGYYSEVLPHLVGRELRYVGLDYSLAMVALGSRSYPGVSFLAGDARRLPLGDGCCDVVLSGGVLMHIPDYVEAIRECRRITRDICVFHTVPVREKGPTTFLQKLAYSGPVAEVIFNLVEIEEQIRSAGLSIVGRRPSVPYDLFSVLGETTWTATFLCRRV